jgi:TRAP-type C4-dicarboxylate transport system permease small subunit
LLVITGFLLAAVYSAAGVTWSQYRSGAVSGTLGMPLWPFTLFIPLGCLLMLLRVLRPEPVPPREVP